MWDKIAKNLKKYPSAVLTGIDAMGYPCSMRCLPRVDVTAQVLRVQPPPGILLQPGPAGLLCHRHNELLWDMESFLLRGSLTRDEDGWNFHPLRFIPGFPGTGRNAVIPAVRLVIHSRSNAQHYLQARHLPRPRIPWDEIMALKTQARRTK
jgi:hypothetical protein